MSEHYTPEFKETLVTFISVESADIDTATGSDTFGHFIVRYANGDTVDYGVVTAYAAAKAAGYAGSEEQWQTELANVMAFVSGQKYDSNGAITDVVEGDAGYQNNAKYYSKVAEGWATGADPEGQPYRNNSAKFWANEAQAALEGLQNMTVGITTGEAGTQAAVMHTQTDGVDHLEFTIPRGEPFTIFKTYQSIASMNADKANVAEGKFVMITSNIDDPDNSKLYVRGADEFVFVTDLSGATGVQGPIATAACDYSYQNSSNGTTPPTGTWTSSPTPVPGTYLWTKIELTWNNAASTVSTIYTVVYNGVNGDVASVDGILPDANGNIALSSTYVPVDSPAFTSSISMGRKANTTVGTASSALGSEVEASGNYSHAEGQRTAATNSYGHAEGYGTEASGHTSHAEGSATKAIGNYSHTEGYATRAAVTYMHASGVYNESYEPYPEWVAGTSYNVGDKVSRSGAGFQCKTANTDATFTVSNWDSLPTNGETIFVVGNGADSLHRSDAFKLDWEGNGEFQGDVVANGCGGANPVSLAGLDMNKADKADTTLTTTLSRGRKSDTTVGTGSFAFGNSVTASGYYSFAEGSNTSATGQYSHAAGHNTKAEGDRSYAEGFYTKANLTQMHAAGRFNVDGTLYPIWEANTTYAIGDKVSRVNMGFICAVANTDSSWVDDHWDSLPSNGDTAFVVGNGISEVAKSNAFKLDWDGNGEFQGDVIANGNGGSNPISLTSIGTIQDVSNLFTLDTSYAVAPTSATVSAYKTGRMISGMISYVPSSSIAANSGSVIQLISSDSNMQPNNIATFVSSCSNGLNTVYAVSNGVALNIYWLTAVNPGNTVQIPFSYMCAGL